MGKDLVMTGTWTLSRALVIVLAASLALQCNDGGTTKHYKYIGSAEWSPTAGNLLVITKDEYDVSEGSGSGCGNDVIEIPPPAQFQLFLADTSGAVLKQLTQVQDLGAGGKMKFSPRGDRILFWASSMRLSIVDTSGTFASSDSIGYTSEADWSPDGSRIIVSANIPTSAVPRLSVINADGSGFQCLNRSLRTGSVSWSTRNQIAFVYQVSSRAYLATIDPDGNNMRTLDSALLFYNTRWSPDGSALLVVQGDSVTQTVYRIVPATGRKDPVIQFVDNTVILSVRFSPDGTMISYYTVLPPNGFDLYVINADGSNGRSISTASTDGSWSPDSRALAYVYYNAVYTKAVR